MGGRNEHYFFGLPYSIHLFLLPNGQYLKWVDKHWYSFDLANEGPYYNTLNNKV